MKNLIRTLTLVVLVNSAVLYAQPKMEESYENLKKFTTYLDNRQNEYFGTSTGEDIIGFLKMLSNSFPEIASLQQSFEKDFRDRKEQIDQLEDEISRIYKRLEEVKNYDIIGKRYHGNYTIVYNDRDQIFAVSSQIPLHNRKIYRLENNGKVLTIRSSSSFDDFQYAVFDLYDGRYEKNITQIYKKRGEIDEQLTSNIKKFATEIHPKIKKIKGEVLDSLIAINTNKFLQNLKFNDYRTAKTALDALQYFIPEKEISATKYDELANRLYNEQYLYVVTLIDTEEIKSAENQLVVFKDVNWNRIDLKKRSDELYLKLVDKRGKKKHLEKQYLESYQEYLILLKNSMDEKYLKGFFNSFSAYYEPELSKALESKDIKGINLVLDSLDYFDRKFSNLQELANFCDQIRKKIAPFLDEITKVDQDLGNYHFIPGGEHYLDSEFEQSEMYPFLVLKTPADENLFRLIDLSARFDGSNRNQKLAALGLTIISNREKDYVKAGGWMTLKEAGEYRKSFLGLSDLEASSDYLTVKVSDLKDLNLVDELSKRSKVVRDEINSQILEKRKENGFKPFAPVKFGASGAFLGYSYLENVKSYDPKGILKKNELNLWSMQAGLSLYFKLNSDISPIPKGPIRPALTYFETSVNYMFGLQDSAKINDQVFHRIDFGVGLLFVNKHVEPSTYSTFFSLKTGISGSKFDKFNSEIVISPFLSFSYTGLEFYISYDQKANRLNQICITWNLAAQIFSKWFY